MRVPTIMVEFAPVEEIFPEERIEERVVAQLADIVVPPVVDEITAVQFLPKERIQ